MRKIATWILLALTPAFAQNPPFSSPPTPPIAPVPPGGGIDGAISMLCSLVGGNLTINFENWQINLCEISKFFETYDKNTQQFLGVQAHLTKKLDKPLLRTSWFLENINDALQSRGEAPIAQAPKPSGETPAELYRKALEEDPSTPEDEAKKDPREVEKRSLQYVEKTYETLMEDLGSTVNQYVHQVKTYYQTVSNLQAQRKTLQERLASTTPGSPEAEALVNRINEVDRKITDTITQAMEFARKEHDRVTAVQQAVYQAVQDMDKYIADIEGQTGKLGAAQAAKRISKEQTKKFQELIKDANDKVQQLVREAQNATSTRAAVQVLAKGLGQITQATVVTQSLLHSALSELAQQNVYTNQQIAQMANQVARQAAAELAAQAEELNAQMNLNLGKAEVLARYAESWKKTKENLFDNPCAERWFWGCNSP